MHGFSGHARLLQRLAERGRSVCVVDRSQEDFISVRRLNVVSLVNVLNTLYIITPYIVHASLSDHVLQLACF